MSEGESPGATGHGGMEESARFEQLFRAYQPRVRGYFERRGFSHEDACDLTQETFRRVFHHRAEIAERGESLEAWLFAIAGNVGKNAVRDRQAQKRAVVEVPLDDRRGKSTAREFAAPEVGPSGAANPLGRLLDGEQLAALEAAVFDLPLQMRSCFLLRVDRGLKYKEIAAAMRITVDTVKAHLKQAKRRLQERLGAGFSVEGFASEPEGEPET